MIWQKKSKHKNKQSNFCQGRFPKGGALVLLVKIINNGKIFRLDK